MDVGLEIGWDWMHIRYVAWINETAACVKVWLQKLFDVPSHFQSCYLLGRQWRDAKRSKDREGRTCQYLVCEWKRKEVL